MMTLAALVLLGFFATASLGLAASWLDRKVTARVQYRVGPPFAQPFIDIVKLLGKETLVPKGANKAVFFAAPLGGFCSVVLASTILWVNNLDPSRAFVGDWIVVLYLLTLPSLSIILGGFASGNPYASLGASREMKLVLSYELPFVLAVLVPVLQAGGALRLGEILTHQAHNGAVATHASGVLALLVAILCIQAKMGLVPFDMAEAETEIVSGPLVEYSGPALAMYRLMKNMLLWTLPFFLAILFMGGVCFEGIQLLYGVLKVAGILVVMIVLRNTNPRVRIDHAMRFFWGPLTLAAFLAVVMALRGW